MGLDVAGDREFVAGINSLRRLKIDDAEVRGALIGAEADGINGNEGISGCGGGNAIIAASVVAAVAD